jgi:acetyltransferase-like isoleucine patch superfamily enzyme
VIRFLWWLTESADGLFGAGLRYMLLSVIAKEVGDNVLVGPRVRLVHPERLSIGSNVSIHRDCYVDAEGGVWIESDVSIAHACSIISCDHTWADLSLPIRENPLRPAPIIIRSDVWIGCGVRILAGTEIESRSVVAAGAVVVKSVRSGSVVGGVPARVIGSTTVSTEDDSRANV